jgi:hypothetical protein
MIDDETWLPAVGWEGIYAVSDHGQVKRLAYIRDTGASYAEKILRPRPGKNFYQSVALYKNLQKRNAYIHVLVLTAFRGPCPDGMETRHLDGIRTNNRLANLEWGTKAEQMLDMRKHGTFQQGSMRPWSKLTERDVVAIRAELAAGATGRSLAKKYGVWPATISKINVGQNWRHVKP